MILQGRYNHDALHELGATLVRDLTDGNTEVFPDGLDISGIDAETLAYHKRVRIAAMKAAAKAESLGGFSSAVLGASYHYPTDNALAIFGAEDRDQLELNVIVLRAKLDEATPTATMPVLCRNNATGIWARTDHTVAQIIQLGKDAFAAQRATKEKFLTRRSQINAVTTTTTLDAAIAAVNAITW